ncbi:MAG: primosomal protein N' [Lysobacterales bacterium 14-68-21]|jgi:primosomal protein N' (replication factor Y)|nr:MAG: primosomal protein N' [Xanthomonadales bacterium 15-68-25]OZB68422.1 MAG: primosomal protein N' [Xanthomonadales bacterium 14-68-21]
MSTAVRVALPVPLPTLFDYLPPAVGQVAAGQRVLVPFGRGRQVGIVVDAAATSELASARLKPVLQVLDDAPLLDAELLRTIGWAADYWLGAPGEAFAQALPLALREPRPLPDTVEEYWHLTPAGLQERASGRRRGGSLALLDRLADGPRQADGLTAELPDWRSAARRLAAAGLVERCPPPASPAQPRAPAGPALSAEQREAVAAVGEAFGRFQPFLLDGITGSGKTEVYLALIEQALAEGRQSLLLVPEIGLAPQTLRRLRERLGVPIEVLHSNLAEGDRARSWLRARSGEAKVVLGTRSAVFTPLPHAGLILVDEEHDASYKQQEGFRYHARDLALVRARELGVPIVLGSATPSLETLANAASGRFRTLRLRARPGATRPAPQVQIVDVRAQHLDHGLSPALLTAVRETVARGEQVLVFRNRRGYAPVLLCHACGWHADCPRCERPMTLHAGQRQLRCHHCDRRAPVPSHCPACGAGALWPQGQGTERLEEALGALFPEVPVRRIDRETTRRRDAFEHLLEELQQDGPAILVGTQMLAKGHDLPRLTLVAIVSVDEGLHSVDFRAGERLAQLLVQVAGRAGRAERPGRVLLQTHHPEHSLLRTLLASGYGAAAATLLAEREAVQLPPYSHQILLRADAHGRGDVDAFLAAAADALPADPEVQLAGPMPAPMPLRAGRHRGQLLLESTSRARLHAVARPWRLQLGALPPSRRVRWSLDVDPIDLY